MFDGTLSGFWNFALEPMLDHLEAWDAKDIDKARRIWDGGLVQLHEYVADMGRLHIRYKTATWLRGLIPNPFMRSPMPKPKEEEVETLYRLLKALGLPVIDSKEIKSRSLNIAFRTRRFFPSVIRTGRQLSQVRSRRGSVTHGVAALVTAIITAVFAIETARRLLKEVSFLTGRI